jgi:hypothetical protein
MLAAAIWMTVLYVRNKNDDRKIAGGLAVGVVVSLFLIAPLIDNGKRDPIDAAKAVVAEVEAIMREAERLEVDAPTPANRSPKPATVVASPPLMEQAPTANATELFGTVERVLDGDTLQMTDANGETHTARLLGIDCPERGQRFGDEATDRLRPMTDDCHGSAIVESRVNADLSRRSFIVL